VTEVLVTTAPDIVVLQSFDYDLTGAALNAFADGLAKAGVAYPHRYARRPNTGLQTHLDLDGDGRTSDPRDAQGYGEFSGQGGMAILSRYPILEDAVQDYSGLLWKDLPNALLPHTSGGPFPSEQAQSVQRLPTTAHWVVPIAVPDMGTLSLLTFHASPPVFDGPEDRNGKRNHDEIMFWTHYLAGAFGPPPDSRFVMVADTNQDPVDGEGIKTAINTLLTHPMLQDPEPQGAVSDDPTDTVDWEDPVPGNLRVDYVLPSRDLTVLGAGVHWPDTSTPEGRVAATASRHRLVWVDIAR
jgi:hypothetical protein